MLLVMTTMPDVQSARALAGALVEGRLAACVSIQSGCESFYRWNGAVEQAHEGFGLVEGEGAADAAVGECFVGNEKLDTAAGVETRDDVGERGFGEIGEAALPGEGGAKGGGVDLLDGGGRGVPWEHDALAGGDENGV